MVKAHVDLNNQDLRKTLFNKDQCPEQTPNGTTSDGGQTRLTWQSNCAGGDRSSVKEWFPDSGSGQPTRTKHLKLLDMLLSDIPPAPLVSGGHSSVGPLNHREPKWRVCGNGCRNCADCQGGIATLLGAAMSGDLLDEGSEIYFDRTVGVLTSEKVPFLDLTRFRVDGISEPNRTNSLGCTHAYMDTASKTNDRQRFCGKNDSTGHWALPLAAKSPTLGTTKIYSFQGSAYRPDGSKLPHTELGFSVDHKFGIKQYRLLSAAESSRVKATFR